jgi:hypothetical protein
VELEAHSAKAHNRLLAIVVAVTVVLLAALAYAVAAFADFTLSGSQSLDPHRRGYAVVGVFAAVSCTYALWRPREVARGRTGWGDAGLGLAIFALFVLLAVAFASRLGG